jgi:hypothetical protein
MFRPLQGEWGIRALGVKPKLRFRVGVCAHGYLGDWVCVWVIGCFLALAPA